VETFNKNESKKESFKEENNITASISAPSMLSNRAYVSEQHSTVHSHSSTSVPEFTYSYTE
jgi:hypothetical protein